MVNPSEFYKKQYESHLKMVNGLKRQLNWSSLARILVYLGIVMGGYFFIKSTHIVIPIVIVGVVLFVVLLTRHTNLKAKAALYDMLSKINKEELTIASGDFKSRYDGLEFMDPTHAYCLDIDLFGKGSFFQYIDRTAVEEGTQALADLLKANNVEGIESQQEAIKDLASKPEWRQLYTAKASLVKTEVPAEVITHWLENYNPFMPSLMGWFPYVFGALSIIVMTLGAMQIIPIPFMAYWIIIGLGITAIYLKKVNTLAMHTSKASDTFRQYAQLLKLIEETPFESELLQAKQQQIQSKSEKASEIFKRFSKALDGLDNRNNMISAFLGNGLVLWDTIQAYKIEKWIQNYASTVNNWFEVVAFFDAYNTLGNFAYNHPEFVFPTIETEGAHLIKAKGLGHPLLQKDKRITSDFQLSKEQFFIITGANMAGKSTFLRTVSLHIVMANMGLPVCAENSSYTPIRLITSMRTTDSLADDSSYFFSELTRLKYIVDTVHSEPYLIILDEILKGTNSTDKAIGSRKFVEKLVAGNATGIIATHDLSLCELEREIPEVQNYYFDAEVIQDELFFDYKFKKGVCENMNASFLLKKMEII